MEGSALPLDQVVLYILVRVFRAVATLLETF